MIRSYLKIAFRSLWKEKIYSFINIFGLAIGIACCILIGANVLHELSFDKFHENANQIFRLVLSEKEPDGSVTRNTLLPAPLDRSLEAEFGNVVHASGLIITRPRIVFEENSPAKRAVHDAYKHDSRHEPTTHLFSNQRSRLR